MSGVSIPPEVPEADMKTCVLIDVHALILIQTLGKPPGCQTFGDYADALMRHVTHHFGEHITRVDVVFNRCRVLSLSDRRYSLSPLSQTRID